MGFNLEVARGRSIAIKPVKAHGAPATINLSELLKTPGKDRAKWLKEHSDQTLGKEAAKQLKEAESLEQLLQALDKKIARKVTPRTVPKGAMVLQPSDERRRSGSHYTPRSLTEPIVRTTLEPILKQLCAGGVGAEDSGGAEQGRDEGQSSIPGSQAPSAGVAWVPTAADRKRYTGAEIAERIRQSEQKLEYARLAREKGVPHPAQILDLKICDPAMGSGAFLVEACRQLAEELVKSWGVHAETLTPNPQSLIPPDEDEVLYARRLVAQRCLYGVDKNEMAVDLAKLSLWLVTLAKDHPFTFLDHSLRHGDSLVGLTRQQIIGFHWEPKKQKQFGEDLIQKRLDRATEARAKILNAREDVPYRDQEQRLALADEALNVVRMTGDACVSAFFAESKPKAREARCEDLFQAVRDWYASGHDIAQRGPIAVTAASLRNSEHPISPFHWEIEYPEVFSRENGGFDAFVGNPPFLGGSRISTVLGSRIRDWLLSIHDESHGNGDLVAHFFRRCFSLIRQTGTFGLIATNTVAQGDTRNTGLRWICKHGGEIYAAKRRVPWPGVAAVVVSVLHMSRGRVTNTLLLDGHPVRSITAYLFHAGGHDDPKRLLRNEHNSFSGTKIYGAGFTFDDSDSSGLASSTRLMRELITADPRNQECIFPYIGGQEVNDTPNHSHQRYVINFREMTEAEARKWPLLFGIVEANVKPERAKVKREKVRANWWQFEHWRPGLYAAISGLEEVLVCSQTSKYLSFTFIPGGMVYSHKLVLIASTSRGLFGVLQSRIHQVWSAFFGSSMKDDPVYTATDCFETFPLPSDVAHLDTIGSEYFQARSKIMVRNNEGMTATYNRLHNPHEKSTEIPKLRELHAGMDRAVLEAYGWHDLAKTAKCEFLLDYQEDDEETGKKKSKKKKPWRLRWPDDFRDEVLARLLELNEQRHKEELLAANSQLAEKKKAARQDAVAKPKRARKKAAEGQKGLEFDNG